MDAGMGKAWRSQWKGQQTWVCKFFSWPGRSQSMQCFSLQTQETDTTNNPFFAFGAQNWLPGHKAWCTPYCNKNFMILANCYKSYITYLTVLVAQFVGNTAIAHWCSVWRRAALKKKRRASCSVGKCSTHDPIACRANLSVLHFVPIRFAPMQCRADLMLFALCYGLP